MKVSEPGGVARDFAVSDLTRARASLFAVCWALAALFHLAGNPRPTFLPDSAAFTVVQVAVGVAAVAVLLRPHSVGRLVLLAGLVPISAWLEAPIVGNHWVLAALISLAYLTAAAWGRRTRRTGESSWSAADATWAGFAPSARLTLLIAYGFAAFAKLNSDFFDPAVSCAVFYQDQLVGSWGLSFLSAAGRPVLGMVAAVTAAAVELSIPLLLIVRRTRRAGVLVALGFHWILAMDLHQHFWDFSSVLFAGFLLFVDDAQLEYVLGLAGRARSAVRSSILTVLTAVATVTIGVAIVATALPSNAVLRVLALLAGHATWATAGTAVLVFVFTATLRTKRNPRPGSLRVPALALLLVPALALFNGLTPYLELKTGFGWNMYGNLQTVAGETNHFIIPRTLDLTGLQADQVEILESSDPALDDLVGNNHALAYSELREYAHTYPDTAMTYRHRGETHEATALRSDDAGRGGVSTLSRRLQSFRVIDTSSSQRCQTAFSPAR